MCMWTRLMVHPQFAYLIELLAKKNKVVVLIDEYDKPILDHIANVPMAICYP